MSDFGQTAFNVTVARYRSDLGIAVPCIEKKV